MKKEYIDVNRKAWSYLATNGCESSLPYGLGHFARARQILDGRGWIPWRRIRTVLCLACGGGQQGPLFASMGYEVTVADLSREQLRVDREVAGRNNLSIQCVEADMLDLTPLYGRTFDLVYQAISACYVPDVRTLYQEVGKVLKPGGLYRVEHWNPAHLQLGSLSWDGEAYRVARPQTDTSAIPWSEQDPNTGDTLSTCWHFLHPLKDLIGSLCEESFSIVRFAESGEVNPDAAPGSYQHMAAYFPSFFVIFARKV